MKQYYTALPVLICLFLAQFCALPAYATAAKPIDTVALTQKLTPGLPIPQGLAIPLEIHTVIDTKLAIGAQKFFRVSEDVLVDGNLLFGAGAIARGYVRGIEKDTAGRCIAVEIELVNVQDVEGNQVALSGGLIKIKTTAVNAGARVRIDAELNGFIPEVVLSQI